MLIQKHSGVFVLRDDILPGGTKSVLLEGLVEYGKEYVYASPVYGGFQIALSLFAKKVGAKATIFCAQRKEAHQNTIACKEAGANIIEVLPGYLSLVEKRAKDYATAKAVNKLSFGALSDRNLAILTGRMKKAIDILGFEPDEIFCAYGSGTLTRAILNGTKASNIIAVQVGKAPDLADPRLRILKYHKPFEKISKSWTPFPSMPNYDLKAWEYCLKYKTPGKTVFFWNVL